MFYFQEHNVTDEEQEEEEQQQQQHQQQQQQLMQALMQQNGSMNNVQMMQTMMRMMMPQQPTTELPTTEPPTVHPNRQSTETEQEVPTESISEDMDDTIQNVLNQLNMEGMDDLVEQLSQRETFGVSKRYLQNMDVVCINDNWLGDYGDEPCPVCFNDFELDEMAVQLDCKHVFHQQCIKTWFEKHNSCPMCRSELETDSEIAEARRLNLDQYDNDNIASMYQ